MKDNIHLEFCTRATRFRFAREPSDLLTPPLRNPEIWTIRTVGTTSWFFEPISTWGLLSAVLWLVDERLTAVSTLNSSEVIYRRSVASSFIFDRLSRLASTCDRVSVRGDLAECWTAEWSASQRLEAWRARKRTAEMNRRLFASWAD